MALSSALATVNIDDAGGGNQKSFTDVLVNFGSIEDATDTVPVGDKTDQRVGARQVATFTIYQNGDGANGFGHFGVLQDLWAAMLAGTEKRVTFVFDGSSNNNFQYDPVIVHVVPRIGQLDQDKAKIWIHDAGAGAPTIGYDDLGLIAGGSSPSFEVISKPDGLGRPFFSRLKMTWDLLLFGEALSATIDAHTGKLKLAIDHGNSTYTTFDNLKFHTLHVGDDEFVYTQLHVEAAGADPRDGSNNLLITWPAAPGNYLFGMDVTLYAAGATKASFFTQS